MNWRRNRDRDTQRESAKSKKRKTWILNHQILSLVAYILTDHSILLRHEQQFKKFKFLKPNLVKI